MFDVLDALGRRTRLAGSVLLVVALSACGDGAEPELNLPSGATTSAPETADAVDAEPAETSSSTTTTETVPVDEGDGYTPVTVSFDPTGDADESTVADFMFDAIQAEQLNTTWCWENQADCVPETHVGPGATEARLGVIDADLQQSFPGGTGTYEAGEEDAIYRLEVLPLIGEEFEIGDDEFRLLGAVFTCEVYNGSYRYPDQEDVTLNVGLFAEYRIWQDRSGAVLVSDQSITEMGEMELCDPVKGG